VSVPTTFNTKDERDIFILNRMWKYHFWREFALWVFEDLGISLGRLSHQLGEE